MPARSLRRAPIVAISISFRSSSVTCRSASGSRRSCFSRIGVYRSWYPALPVSTEQRPVLHVSTASGSPVLAVSRQRAICCPSTGSSCQYRKWCVCTFCQYRAFCRCDAKTLSVPGTAHDAAQAVSGPHQAKRRHKCLQPRPLHLFLGLCPPRSPHSPSSTCCRTPPPRAASQRKPAVLLLRRRGGGLERGRG
eukprot:2289902-Rhodomonas_salina.1